MENNQKPTLNIQPEMQASSSQGDVTPSQTPQSSSKTLRYVSGGIALLLLIGGLFIVLQKSKPTPPPQQPVVQQTLPPKPTLPRSKTQGVITNVMTASSLDAQGKAVVPATAFAKTDKDIYLVLNVNKPKIGTKIEYIRYFNGKYLDNGVNKILKLNVTNTSFAWSLKKPGATHLVGTYKVKVYTNGIFEKETSYTVQ